MQQKTRVTKRFLCLGGKTVPLGPYRVFPGGLAVARAFGDAACKLPEEGGIPGTVTAEPEIMTLQLDEQSQFLVLATDGVWDSFPLSKKLLPVLKEKYSDE